MMELENAWQVFVETKSCPECGGDHYTGRKLFENPQHPTFWKFTCKNNKCQCKWWKPWEDAVNSFG